jgi:hypothetical protein
LYWEAVRLDLTNPGNVGALAAMRDQLRSLCESPGTTPQDANFYRQLLVLTDVRLFDMLIWLVGG